MAGAHKARQWPWGRVCHPPHKGPYTLYKGPHTVSTALLEPYMGARAGLGLAEEKIREKFGGLQNVYNGHKKRGEETDALHCTV